MSSLHAFPGSSISPSFDLHSSFKLGKQRFSVRFNGPDRTSACLVSDKTASVSVGKSKELGLGERTKEVMEIEGSVLVPTYARAPVVLERGKGCKLYDVEGREYLDMTAGIAVNSLGHGDPDWLKAVVEQANTLTHVSNNYYSIPQVKISSFLMLALEDLYFLILH